MDIAAQQQVGLPTFEFALAQELIGLDHPAGDGQQQGEGEVGGRLGQDTRRVGYQDPAAGRRRDIDVVEANRIVGDHPQMRGCRHDLVGDRDVNHPHNADRVSLADALLEGLRRHALGLQHRDFESFAQHVDPGRGERQGDEDPAHAGRRTRRSSSITSMASRGFTF